VDSNERAIWPTSSRLWMPSVMSASPRGEPLGGPGDLLDRLGDPLADEDDRPGGEQDHDERDEQAGVEDQHRVAGVHHLDLRDLRVSSLSVASTVAQPMNFPSRSIGTAQLV
jgi:hypothetical protein